MRALVTGGAGFIGSNLVDALLDRGDSVTIVDDLSTGRRQNLDAAIARGAALVELDILEAGPLNDLLATTAPELVFHLAAQVDVRRSVSDPVHDLAVNGSGTLNVLAAARACGAQRVVYSSTGGAIYGDTETIPTPESVEPAPLAPYGQSKYAGEGYCRLYAELHGLGTTALRFANVYGPRQDPLGEGGVIAIYCGLAIDGGEPVAFGDGEQTRDFVYVGDVVAALLRAAGGTGGFGPFNIGTGEEISVNALAERVGAVAGRAFSPRHEPERPGEVRRSCLDPSAARDQLGWAPATSLDEGLRTTLAWAADASSGT